MTVIGWLGIVLVLTAVVLCAWPLGNYMANVFQGRTTPLSPVLDGIERGIYRAAGIKAEKEQGWLTYTLAMLVFNGAGFIFLYGLMRLQGVLPVWTHFAPFDIL